MKKKLETEVKVGVFVLSGVILIMLSTIILGGSKSFFTKKITYTTHFTNVDGLISGAKVILGGVPVGIVDSVTLDIEHRNIQVLISVEKMALEWIRKDTVAEVATQGVLGDKYISLSSGSLNEEVLPPGSDIEHRASKDIAQFINKGDALMLTLNTLASTLEKIMKGFEDKNRSEVFFENLAKSSKNFAQVTDKLNKEVSDLQVKGAISNLHQILEKINRGTGTLGALINDPSLYDEARALLGGANRSRVMRNLVRQTIRHSESDSDHPETSSEPKGHGKKK